MSMTQTQHHNVPALRFPEFSGEWETKNLGNFFTFKNGVNANKSQYGHGHKFINVLDIIADHPITSDSIIGSVSISEKEFKTNEVVFGDILFQRSSETREEVGQSNVYLDKGRSATFGGFVIRGHPETELNSEYFDALLKTSKARKDITSRSGGSTRYNVGQASLSAVLVNVSTTLLEQQKIASFLSSVDRKITQLRQKKTLLQQYKKGMMQKLFSQELRFKGAQGNDFPDWERKRLGELAKITTGKLDANAMVPEGPYRFYTCAKQHFQIDEYAFDADALLISGNGANVGYVHHYNGKFNAYQRTYVLDGFFETILYVKFYLDFFLKRRIGIEKKDGNTPYIVMSTLSEMLISLPCPEEQQKIADFLSSIDRKIDLVTTELDHAKTFKKGLLQQMFI